jgi:hypothetical protein
LLRAKEHRPRNDMIHKGEKMAKKNKRPTQAMTNNPPQRFEFNPDYSMVKKDLKRIGVLAGFFITVLVVLSFILK